MEEALWELEDKLKLSTREAVLVLASAALVLTCLCTVTILKRRTVKMKEVREHGSEQDHTISRDVKQALIGSVRWSKTRKWSESPTPLLREKGAIGEVGWGSHNSDSPMWQRPILMGEKCEFPKFSGLILYDRKGRPIWDNEVDTTHQGMKAPVEKTTLRDLL